MAHRPGGAYKSRARDRAHDVVVVGAGAAGLACAARLREHGTDVAVLEARDRFGGRILTLHPRSLPAAIELGAEFIHGEPPEPYDIANEAGLRVVDIAGRRFQSSHGALRMMDDFWERLDVVMRRLRDNRRSDRSFADALASATLRGVPAHARALARQYVEGFHAADARRISEAALAAGGSPRGDVRERRIARVLEGYDAVISALAAPVLDVIETGVVVREVRWKRGHVEIACSRRGAAMPAIAARAVVITVPLGVLLAPASAVGAIVYDPPVPALGRATAQMAMGHVRRVTLQFDEPFWIDERIAHRLGDDRLDTLGFLHARGDVAFPVWWTAYPVRAPVMTGWRGGTGALPMQGLTRDEVASLALTSLARLLGMSRPALARRVVAVFTHDWSSDPFARGAYSYVTVGGSGAARRLARPVHRTLFFAGEHADREERSGTVHGAIASGRQAADAVLRV